MTPEEASALAVRAMAADLETWATESADVNGRVGVLDLVQVLDAFRDASPV